MTRSLTIQTRIDPDTYDNLVKITALRGETLAEYLRNALKQALINEPRLYKMMLKKEKARK